MNKEHQRDSPVHQPLQTLVGGFEEEVRAEASEKERDACVQLLVDLFGLDAALQSHRRRTEQSLLKVVEGRFDTQQLLQPGAACRGRQRLRGYRLKRITTNYHHM